MQVTPATDPRLDYVFQGVRQAPDGQLYRQGVFKDGSVAYVDAADSRVFSVSDGSFSDNTRHALVTDNGFTRRCGDGLAA